MNSGRQGMARRTSRRRARKEKQRVRALHAEAKVRPNHLLRKSTPRSYGIPRQLDKHVNAADRALT
jgi:hypothetical protein